MPFFLSFVLIAQNQPNPSKKPTKRILKRQKQKNKKPKNPGLYSTLGQPFFLHDIFFSEVAAFEFLNDHGIFDFNTIDSSGNKLICSKCNKGTMVPISNKPHMVRCSRRNAKLKCGHSYSILRTTFFSKMKVPLNKVLLIGYLWLLHANWTTIQLITGCSEEVVTNTIGFYRNLVAMCVNAEDITIGGEGIEVEIDESKIGKRMYNRGHRVVGFWVFGGVERTPDRKFFMIPVEDRSRATLLPIIQQYIKPGSIIISDCWAAYNDIGVLPEGYTHRTVNHSKEFVAADGTNSNTIEANWRTLKRHWPQRSNNIDRDEALLEAAWRRRHYLDMWDALIMTFLYVHWD